MRTLRSAVCIVDCRNTLGEGCVWDPRCDSLFWTDIEESRVYRLGLDGYVQTYAMPERVAFILPRTKPGFVVGFASRIALSDPSFENCTTIVTVERALPQTRVNDAAVDPDGGLVFGTFDERDRLPVAALYHLSASGRLSRLLSGVTISNGLAFSVDGTVMYFADTADGVIRRFRFDADVSKLAEFSPLACLDVAPGRPDGAVVDSEGCYWSARVWGGCVVRITPEGRVVQRVDLPVRGPTCVALGGQSAMRLFVTTLRTRQTEQELSLTPQAGGVFSVDVPVPGQPQRLCAL